MTDDPPNQRASGSDVFVSSASQDGTVANAIVEALQRTGIRCWIAPRDVVPGEIQAGAIVHAIDASRVIVLVLSANSTTSQHVLRGVERASSKGLPVVSFRLDFEPLPADLEYFLNASQWLDAGATGVERALPKLVDAVRRVLNPAGVGQPDHGGESLRPALVAPQPPAPVRQRKRPGFTLIALVTVVAVAVAYIAVDKRWKSRRMQTEAPVTVVQPVAPAGAPATHANDEKSVAVLPFADMSEKKDQEYFSDGMAEEIIDQLVKVPDLHFPARTSSFYFKGKSDDVPTIAKRLMVAHVLEGSVRRSDSHSRITAQLARADSGYHLWSETYDRKVDDIFKVQDEIAAAVVKALRVSLLKSETPRFALTTSTDAYTLQLQARAIAAHAGQTDYEAAIGLLRQALKPDPKFAAAQAELAGDGVDLFNWYEWNVRKDILIEAHQAAAKALELDASLVDGHLAMAKLFVPGRLELGRRGD